MNNTSPFRTKRIYEKPLPSDGKRILVDCLWPRGISRERASIDRWLRGLAPSDALRRSYDHSPEMWAQFRENYFSELHNNGESIKDILRIAKDGPVTLLFSHRDEKFNNALVLKEYLDKKWKKDEEKWLS